MLSICAIIAARNEAQYLKILLPFLAEQNIDVVIIDNESTDSSHEIYSKHTGSPIIQIEHIPYKNYFSLTEQLNKKKKILNQLKHDWVIHHDADEIFEHYKPGLNLRNAIQEADDNGFNALNFDEFVFLPEPDQIFSEKNYYLEMLRYYFFEPIKNRKNAAWKRTSDLDNRLSGGHILSGNKLSISPINHIVRHYIALSNTHAINKYFNRKFSAQDLEMGWHRRRSIITKENLKIPYSNPFLFRLSSYDSKDFHREKPSSKHYWEWENGI